MDLRYQALLLSYKSVACSGTSCVWPVWISAFRNVTYYGVVNIQTRIVFHLHLLQVLLSSLPDKHLIAMKKIKCVTL